MDGLDVLTVAVPFVWLGMVVAISFVETPLKFRAPGVTLPLGLGIGRVVFGALAKIEAVLAVVLAVLIAVSDLGEVAEVVVLAALVALLVLQALVVRPRLSRRTDAVVAGTATPGSHLHLVFIGLDALKLIGLGVLGVLLATAAS
jgi:hypothetical protein